ncbi:uncharacterized protein F5891DRAFT_1210049 [Suillus fuscotomentosus]|uniref:3'-5' exonuclease domain-containing protein n=1 Tax=Suillus fuscotomentosus TaxID=1912939 RepID=A0AAD4EC67_9AGAM|nr:uncharacterized protein F5891DRAFT_1210049 [Suillus fuscotomentosus]KAG1903564.1 hypothetical protein F5891DRAFT_1210049 [Suillus fuscotomentosus]
MQGNNCHLKREKEGRHNHEIYRQKFKIAYTNYCTPSPAVVYTHCEDEAKKLVQTLESTKASIMIMPAAIVPLDLTSSGTTNSTGATLRQIDYLADPGKPNETVSGKGLDDGKKLYRDFGITTQGLVELGALAHVTDDTFSSMYKRRVVSLAKMVAMYLECNLVKSKECTSNWEADLNNKMVHSLMVHLKLLDLAKAGNKELDPTQYTSSVDPPSQRAGSTKVISSPMPLEFNVPSLAPTPPHLQYMRAYNLWHHRNTPLDKMCDILKTGGSYMVGAIQADMSLPFNMSKLLELVKMEAGSWSQH